MKNTINYYYNLSIENLIKDINDYYFYIGKDEYHLIKYNRPLEDLNSIYKLNMQMIKKNIMVHKIILNKDNSVVTNINNNSYILLKLCKCNNKYVYLNEINYIQKNTYNIEYDKLLLRDDWINLWSEKIDYYEYQINQLGKDYPILCDSLGYFIGLGENAISYLVNNIKNNNKVLVVSHKRIDIKSGSFEFYNPLNFIIDDRVRDLSEYIKNGFFNNCFNFNEIKLYLDYNNLSKEEYILLYSRLLFPTYYFDIYDNIINTKSDESKIMNILNLTTKYESFLVDFYKYIIYKKKVQLEPIEWLMKRYC